MAAACAALGVAAPLARAQYNAPTGTYAAPATYYNAATSTDATTLRNQLHTIVKTGFTSISYDGLKDTIPVYDRDPANPNNVNAADPGFVATGMNGHAGVLSVEQGAEPVLRLAAGAVTGTLVGQDGPTPW